jgi:hypothetical protein
MRRFAALSREEECGRLLDVYAGDFDRLSIALDRQFRTLHDRAQLILAICGILISASVLVTTGKLIGRPTYEHQRLAGILLAGAGVMEIMAAAVVVGSVLRVRWISQQPGGDLRGWVLSNLAYRDAKTRSYRAAVLLVMLAMLSYTFAVSIALVQL